MKKLFSHTVSSMALLGVIVFSFSPRVKSMQEEDSNLEKKFEELSTTLEDDDSDSDDNNEQKIILEMDKYQSFFISVVKEINSIKNKENHDENDKKKLFELKNEHEKIKTKIFNMIEEQRKKTKKKLLKLREDEKNLSKNSKN